MDSSALSHGDKSGLIAVPGDCDSLYLWDRIDWTLHALVRRMSIGHWLLSLYLPNLKQSQIERSVMLESINDSVAADESRSLDDLAPFGVPLGDSFKPKMTMLNLRSDCEARLKLDLELLLPNGLFPPDEASE